MHWEVTMTTRELIEQCLDYPMENINDLWFYLAGGILFFGCIGFMTLVVEVVFGWLNLCWRLGKNTIRLL